MVLPASADGRDLAPRLALALGRPLHAGAIQVDAVAGASVVRGGGLVVAEVDFDGPVVATLQPGSRGTDARRRPPGRRGPWRRSPALAAVDDAEAVGLRAADPATIDLAEARRIVAGGAGLGSRP